ncbi:hypothetical protein EF910_05955 [Streptomyces sp. WAC07149]|uniref:nSTAND3 domain-containing NTPase n=1 Tax=Streptomyces sp. WAC07149 TaxID=2487425 RepID=UPI000F787A28|nr:restriction endonuclease [Streptomyces sp. WAC07149]RST07231.1 hypothetical protein EF910_05955 [Streptomyces sp. WAC07149]
MTRNYADLSPHDFEVLVRDLLQAEFDVRMETFPQGRDGGIDIRLHHGGVDSIIIQCKHSPGRTFAQIRNQLELEARKIGSRFTSRYMLATSASLTRGNKQQIARIFSGVNLQEDDILGVDDIDNLLTRHPCVETQNFKLWITSSAVLQHLLTSDLHLRSSGLVDRIVKRRRLYVRSEAYAASREMLAAHHVCVISGEPGIGKTTLAETLLVRFMADDWEVNVASADVSDIQRVWRASEKQIFLYDDFLGQNSLLDNLNKNEDRRLVQITERIAGDRSKRLIMTTREYILQESRQVYPRLKSSPLLYEDRVVLNLSDYTRVQKAQIFYNHVYFADLGEEALKSIISKKNYLQIIEHPNFNPRMIELVTSNFRDSGVPNGNFHRYALEALNNPRELWESIFQDQLSPVERILLLTLATVRQPMEVGDLFKGVAQYESASGTTKTPSHGLSLALKKLQGTFIHVASNARLDDQLNGIHPDNCSVIAGLANPSFIDFISSYLSSHPSEISQIAQGAAFFEQVETLVHWDMGGDFDQQLLVSLMDAFFGSRSYVKPNPRLAPGQQHVIMGALVRLEDAASCYWVESADYGPARVRRPVSELTRHLVMTMMDVKYRRRLLSGRPLSVILEKLTRRITAKSAISVGQEMRLISNLALYPEMRQSVTRARDAIAERLMQSLSSPEDFQTALLPFVSVGANPSEWSTAAEVELRRRFLDFASAWDSEEAGRVNTVPDCQESLSRLESAIEDFECFELEAKMLKERLTLLEDEVAQDLDFQDEDVPHEDYSAPPKQQPAEKTYGMPFDPVVDLFGSLGS